LKPDNLWILVVPIVLWVIQLCSFLYLLRVLRWVFSHSIFTAAYQTVFGNRTQGHNDGDASGDAVELQVVSNNDVSAPADTTTITIPGRDSVHGLAHPDVPVAIPVTVTADGKAHTGVPMDIPEDALSDGGSIWHGGVNHSTSVDITNIMTSGGGVSSLVEVVGYPALHLPVLASRFEVGLQPLNLHRRISDLVRKQNARAQREHVRGVAAAGDLFAAATVHGPAGSDSLDGGGLS
jgi:hypothetical protein